jgi:hypothetical protein
VTKYSAYASALEAVYAAPVEASAPPTPGRPPLLPERQLPEGLVSATVHKEFGAIFLGLQIAGSFAQLEAGRIGFYAVSLAGGLVSGASTVASAGSLARHGAVPMPVAGIGAVLASITSAVVNLPLVARIAREHHLLGRVARSLGIVAALGIVGAIAGTRVVSILLRRT